MSDPGMRLRAAMIDGEKKRLGHGKVLADDWIQAEEENPIICAPTPLGEYVSPSQSGWQAPPHEPCRGYDRLQQGTALSDDLLSPSPCSGIAHALPGNDARWGQSGPARQRNYAGGPDVGSQFPGVVGGLSVPDERQVREAPPPRPNTSAISAKEAPLMAKYEAALCRRS